MVASLGTEHRLRRAFFLKGIEMLVVSRKVGEKILIDGGIEVVIVGIRGDKVRVGIEAPKSVTVVREELVKGDEVKK
jgi:carbon storage regulator